MTKISKITYLVLGLGIGIIISSTFYSFYPRIKQVELSDDIIIQRAIELGMVSLKESINTDQIVKEKIELENEEVSKDELYIKIKIEKGDILKDVAEKLFSLNLIDNKEEFILLAEDKMVDKLFAYGTYDIKMNTSYSTIIKILTKLD